MKSFEIRTREKILNHEQRIKSLESGGGSGGGGGGTSPELEADVRELQQQVADLTPIFLTKLEYENLEIINPNKLYFIVEEEANDN